MRNVQGERAIKYYQLTSGEKDTGTGNSGTVVSGNFCQLVELRELVLLNYFSSSRAGVRCVCKAHVGLCRNTVRFHSPACAGHEPKHTLHIGHVLSILKAVSVFSSKSQLVVFPVWRRGWMQIRPLPSDKRDAQCRYRLKLVKDEQCLPIARLKLGKPERAKRWLC